MHAFWRQDVDGASERRGRRGYENGEASVVKFLNDECRNESFFNLGQRRLPNVLFTHPRQLLGKTPKQCIAWEFLENRFVDSIPGSSACRRADRNTDEKTH